VGTRRRRESENVRKQGRLAERFDNQLAQHRPFRTRVAPPSADDEHGAPTEGHRFVDELLQAVTGRLGVKGVKIAGLLDAKVTPAQATHRRVGDAEGRTGNVCPFSLHHEPRVGHGPSYLGVGRGTIASWFERRHDPIRTAPPGLHIRKLALEETTLFFVAKYP
jgi:hypothetical protein